MNSVEIPTLDHLLTKGERLPAEDQAMLEELLRGHRIESWRRDTAAEAKKSARALRVGKLTTESVEPLIARLRDTE